MSWTKTIILVTVFMVTAGATQISVRSERVQPNLPFDRFPLDIGTWQGTRSLLDADIFNVLGVEDYVLADYRPNNGISRGRINLYVGFYQSQSQGDIIHSPKNCLPGAGWKITKTQIVPVRFADDDTDSRIARLLLEKHGTRQVVLYWYQSRGRIIASEYWQKIWLVLDSITRQRTDGSFVRLIAPVVRSEADTFETLKAFARDIKPYLDNHIPS